MYLDAQATWALNVGAMRLANALHIRSSASCYQAECAEATVCVAAVDSNKQGFDLQGSYFTAVATQLYSRIARTLRKLDVAL